MKPKDNPDITKWKLLRGMPRISPHFVDAAKKMAPKSLQPFIAPAGVKLVLAVAECFILQLIAAKAFSRFHFELLEIFCKLTTLP